MAEQGFEGVLVAGDATDARWLLSRQSVVLGVSDGAILARPRPTVPVDLPSNTPPVPPQLLDRFRSLQLRNSLPPGVCLSLSNFAVLCMHAAPVLICKWA